MSRSVVLCGTAILAVWATAVATRAHDPATDVTTPAVPGHATSPAAEENPTTLSLAAQREVIGDYCLTCHDDDKEKGGLTLEKFDPARAERTPR